MRWYRYLDIYVGEKKENKPEGKPAADFFRFCRCCGLSFFIQNQSFVFKGLGRADVHGHVDKILFFNGLV
ncbi:hypothetical protein [Microbulbifer rhizosphaerae]|uniref:Uncharacterized protein n=1 Tax=Microbulbifer rhizosphaerae TaxID=1562603 RepID=A0A7W4WD58_9GAMM|nr:hypothetical protein [Microbulbifer rhizosphaerae]MBB3062040.1 hypothetical protein [Microbulbifer rhizosphaerae]